MGQGDEVISLPDKPGAVSSRRGGPVSPETEARPVPKDGEHGAPLCARTWVSGPAPSFLVSSRGGHSRWHRRSVSRAPPAPASRRQRLRPCHLRPERFRRMGWPGASGSQPRRRPRRHPTRVTSVGGATRVRLPPPSAGWAAPSKAVGRRACPDISPQGAAWA